MKVTLRPSLCSALTSIWHCVVLPARSRPSSTMSFPRGMVLVGCGVLVGGSGLRMRMQGGGAAREEGRAASAPLPRLGYRTVRSTSFVPLS